MDHCNHAAALLAGGFVRDALLVATAGLALAPSHTTAGASLQLVAGRCRSKLGETAAARASLGAAFAAFQRAGADAAAAAALELAALADSKAAAGAALRVLERLPWPLCLANLALLNQYARLSALAGAAKSKKLEQALWRILDLEPLALDAMKSLMTLFDVDPNLLLAKVPQPFLKWVDPLLQAFQLSRSCLFSDAKSKLIIAQQILKQNSDVTLEIADCHVKEGNYILAHYLFDQVRQKDPYTIKHMDQFARILQTQGTHIQLNRLATDLMALSEDRPEPWIVMARYCETKGDMDRAMHLVEKSLLLGSNHAEGHLLKGSLLLGQSKPQEAITSFRTAHQLSPGLESYRGLMESYIACKRTKEALAIAKEAIQRMPNNAKAVVLVGCVFSHMPDRKAQAASAFARALEMDPKCTEALYALVSSLVGDSKHKEAVALLQNNLIHTNNHITHTRLGDIYTCMKEYDRAMDHYNIALKIDGAYEAARTGFERVEKLIGKMDEDGADQSMEEEEDV